MTPVDHDINLDHYGLPCQSNGDRNDQLQRVGAIITCEHLTDGYFSTIGSWCFLNSQLVSDQSLQISRGRYVRYIGGEPDNVSADQLISILAAWVATQRSWNAFCMFIQCLMRLGFAQNSRDGLSAENTRWKIPDFMLIRALPLFWRLSWVSVAVRYSLSAFFLAQALQVNALWLIGLIFTTDFLLFANSLITNGPVWRDDEGYTKRTVDDVDDNVTLLTLLVCRAVFPTPLSWLATKIFVWTRPMNFGSRFAKQDGRLKHVVGAVLWYHRRESGGNPMVGELYRRAILRYM